MRNIAGGGMVKTRRVWARHAGAGLGRSRSGMAGNGNARLPHVGRNISACGMNRARRGLARHGWAWRR